MAGLDPAIHHANGGNSGSRLKPPRGEERLRVPILNLVVPIRIDLLDQRDFSGPLPAFEVRLAANGVRVKRILLRIDEMGNVVFLAELRTTSLAVRLNTFVQVRCNADVKGAVALAGKDVDKTAWLGHGAIVKGWMAGSSPAMVSILYFLLVLSTYYSSRLSIC